MADDAVFEKARQKAFRFLSLRDHSIREIRSKLLERGFEDHVVSRVISRLQELGYLDDDAFSKNWALNLASNRLYGNRRIEKSLIEKGISRGLIREAIAGARKEHPEREVLKTVIGKKLHDRKIRDLDRKERQRLGRTLLGKGFPSDLIFDLLRIQEEGSFDERE